MGSLACACVKGAHERINHSRMNASCACNSHSVILISIESTQFLGRVSSCRAPHTL